MNRGPAGSNRLSQLDAYRILAAGLALALITGLVAVGRSSVFQRADHAFLDGYLRHSFSGRPATQTLVVDIDDVSLSAVGQWPWPRYRVASLIERIAEHGPAAIGLDVLFAEPDRTSLDSIRDTFKRDFGVDVAIDGVPRGLFDNDGYLGYTIATHGVVAADYFYFDHVNNATVVPRTGLSFGGRRDALDLDAPTGVLVNADAIASQTRTTGFLNQRPDDDGMLRRLPLLLEHGGTLHPSLSLATTMRAMRVASGTIASDDDGLEIRIGEHRVPIDAHGSAIVPFDGQANRIPSVSAVDVLAGRVRPEDVAGKVVIVGSSAAGLNDVHATAVDPRFPGAKVHATMAEAILSDDLVRVPAWSPAAIVAACLVAGALVSASFAVASGVVLAMAGSAIAIALPVWGSFTTFDRAGLFISPAAPVSVVVVLFVGFSVARFAIERTRADRWRKQLENARQVTIESMASVAETRDPETGAHIKRTQHYVAAVARELQRTGHHASLLTDAYIELLFLSAPLHDIGKVGVPDHILLKPGKLTPEELVLMRQHAEYGRRIIFNTSERIDGDNFLVIAGEIAGTHHERWDGNGYPLGLAGPAIPLSGRIMAVADIYDALISRRCYKAPFPHAMATDWMREHRGTIFDPVVLDAFFAIEDDIVAIAARYADDAEGTGSETAEAAVAPPVAAAN